MTEKVLLTREQAEAISSIKNLDYAIDIHSAGRQPHASLKDLETSVLAKALLIGYEIEQPKFKTGDKVVNNDGSKIGGDLKIGTISGYDIFGLSFLEEVPGAFIGPKFRHATPEEIFWLETLKRDKVPQFRKGDIFIDDDGDGFDILTDALLSRAYAMYVAGNFQGIHPGESFVPFKKEDSQ